MDIGFIIGIWQGYDLDQIYGAGTLFDWKAVQLGFFCIEEVTVWSKP